jgi:4-hydroxythreonine-4-phosphate dehydrogenase
VTVPTKPLALTMGEPAGIGGEITLKAWRAERDNGAAFFVVDDAQRLIKVARNLGFDIPIEEISEPDEATTIFRHALPVLSHPLPRAVRPGIPHCANAEAVCTSISRAVSAVLENKATAVVTNPIHKKTLADAGFPHPGHTEYLAELTGAELPVMMLACPGLRVVPITIHVPLKDAITQLSAQAIIDAGRITAQALITDFAISSPRLAVAGLNPHAGEQGMLGSEEQDIIIPAVNQLRQDGLAVTGPAPADTLFHDHAREQYDAVLCMYHDQALIPLKTVDFHHGVDITLGLPIVRTSPDHGTAFEIAGSGTARATSLLAALHLAHSMAETRARAQAPSAGKRVIGGN